MNETLKRVEVFNYNGKDVAFEVEGDNVMVNATEMAKVFGKLPAHFLSNQQTKSFILAMKNQYRISDSEIIVVLNGGVSPGTWMHRKLALKFAAWLNADFELWVFDRIEELLSFGVTATQPTIEAMINDPDFGISLFKALKEKREEAARLLEVNQLQSHELQKQAPKVQYYDEVLTSESTYKTTVIAKELGMSAINLNKALHLNKVQYKIGESWVLYSQYQDKGYTDTETYAFTKTNGEKGTHMQTVWTEKGRKFIHDLIRKTNVA